MRNGDEINYREEVKAALQEIFIFLNFINKISGLKSQRQYGYTVVY